MRRLPALLLVALGGCSSLGGDGETAIVTTELRNETFSVVDNRITSVDGKRFERPVYAARVPPGARTVGTQSTLRVSKQVRQQYCALGFNAEPGCTYRLAVPAYPRSMLDQPADAEWRLARPMTLVAECPDTSYAIQVEIDCAGRP